MDYVTLFSRWGGRFEEPTYSKKKSISDFIVKGGNTDSPNFDSKLDNASSDDELSINDFIISDKDDTPSNNTLLTHDSDMNNYRKKYGSLLDLLN